MEVEPIFRQVGDTFSFSHPSFQEVLTAKQFADEINSGRLSVEDAYRCFWSYEEDAELWGLPKDREWRALLPAWKRVLSYTISELRSEKVKELMVSISESYIAFDNLSPLKYNPFLEDVLLAADIIFSRRESNGHFEGIVVLFENKLGRCIHPEWEKILRTLGRMRCEEAINVLKKYFGTMSMPSNKYTIADILARTNNPDAIEFLVNYMQDRTKSDRYIAAIVLTDSANEKAKEVLSRYLSDPKNPSRDLIMEDLRRKEHKKTRNVIQYDPAKWGEVGVSHDLMNLSEDELLGRLHSAIDTSEIVYRLAKKGTKKALYAITDFMNQLLARRYRLLIEYNKAHNAINPEGDHLILACYETISVIHERLKPKGYNPAVKRLAA